MPPQHTFARDNENEKLPHRKKTTGEAKSSDAAGSAFASSDGTREPINPSSPKRQTGGHTTAAVSTPSQLVDINQSHHTSARRADGRGRPPAPAGGRDYRPRVPPRARPKNAAVASAATVTVAAAEAATMLHLRRSTNSFTCVRARARA